MNIYSIRDIDTMGSKAKIFCSLRCHWRDSRLTWTPSAYGDIKYTTVQTDENSNSNYIWTPDLEAYENSNPSLKTGLRMGKARINHTGEVDFDYNGYIEVNLNLTLGDYPYDS